MFTSVLRQPTSLTNNSSYSADYPLLLIIFMARIYPVPLWVAWYTAPNAPIICFKYIS